VLPITDGSSSEPTNKK
jgi:hypothetical protein